ncbi:MAG: glutamate mutase L [Chloroflexi bacterium]|nr:glutamate mutase L [Chloroflexota bacterium]
MGIALLVDIGSTYTKITAVDLQGETVVGRTEAASTVATDMTLGLERARSRLLEQMGIAELQPEITLACSSAAGGLRMAAIGLVPGLTTEAAKRAALGAGAKVIGVYSHKMTRRELAALEQTCPDLILLAGGTDGGNEEVILHNARILAGSRTACPIVVAGNKVAADEIETVLSGSGKEVRMTENVMPEVGRLNVEPARATIREAFMQRIVHGKCLDKAEQMIGRILMPTPMAVLNGAKLLAAGTPEEPGIGDLVVVDVGGATTDVVSVCEGSPSQGGVVLKGLPEPFAKRTVEGDLGIRYNAPTILEIAGRKQVLGNMVTEDTNPAPCPDLEAEVQRLACHIEAVPRSDQEFLVDIGLARTAVGIAMERHAGSIEPVYTASGAVQVQYGKDLTQTRCLVGTGGVFTYGRQPRRILEGALFDEAKPFSLKPKNPELFVDGPYILYAMGLLSEVAPEAALRIMKRYLKKI